MVNSGKKLIPIYKTVLQILACVIEFENENLVWFADFLRTVGDNKNRGNVNYFCVLVGVANLCVTDGGQLDC